MVDRIRSYQDACAAMSTRDPSRKPEKPGSRELHDETVQIDRHHTASGATQHALEHGIAAGSSILQGYVADSGHVE